MLEWDKADERYFQHGVDRGVLYPEDKPAVVWNGITGVDESGNGTTTVHYVDGEIFLTDGEPTDYSGKLTAFYYPNELNDCIGMPEVADGFRIDNQKPQRFNLSYRALIGSGLSGDMFGYEIHLLYNVVASIGSKSRKTVNDSPDPMSFEFDLSATPVPLPGYRPSSHFVIDTRYLQPGRIEELEEILYGDSASLPNPEDIFELINFGDTITVTGTADHIKFEGRRSKVYLLNKDEFQIDGINAVDNGDGTFTVSDGPNTIVHI